jgi:hypothetical protein
VDWSSRKQTSVCKPNCKPTAQHSMALDITDQDHRTRNAELGHTLSYWTTQGSMRIIELENRCTDAPSRAGCGSTSRVAPC